MASLVQIPKSIARSTRRTLRLEEGRDYLLENNEELPYTLVKNLGHGNSANVEMVRDENNGSVYARKVFRICGTRDERRRIFDNEIDVIRRLAPHHHVVRVFATYVAKQEVGLILTPVAERGDLEAFLHHVHDSREADLLDEEDVNILRSSFGCLASGLSFMHGQNIRHKDIKPRNILVHRRTVLYTDFGYSLHYANGSTSVGRPNSLTWRYCAPEVKEWDPRNSKSDIFSLGCVFLEIIAAINGWPNVRENTRPYHEVIEEAQTILRKVRSDNTNICAAVVAEQMLEKEPQDRPSASTITDTFWTKAPNTLCENCKTELQLSSLSSNDSEQDAPWGIRSEDQTSSPPLGRILDTFCEEPYRSPLVIPTGPETLSSTESPRTLVKRHTTPFPRRQSTSSSSTISPAAIIAPGTTGNPENEGVEMDGPEELGVQPLSITREQRPQRYRSFSDVLTHASPPDEVDHENDTSGPAYSRSSIANRNSRRQLRDFEWRRLWRDSTDSDWWAPPDSASYQPYRQSIASVSQLASSQYQRARTWSTDNLSITHLGTQLLRKKEGLRESPFNRKLRYDKSRLVTVSDTLVGTERIGPCRCAGGPTVCLMHLTGQSSSSSEPRHSSLQVLPDTARHNEQIASPTASDNEKHGELGNDTGRKFCNVSGCLSSEINGVLQHPHNHIPWAHPPSPPRTRFGLVKIGALLKRRSAAGQSPTAG